ncbi:phage tail tape measure protein [Winogradskya humida]|uniref:Phage tail tape measure protein domain-containing protein n=1 Tax=Winogradskya humida TaxID=113566 RepID=A0ABQ4A759_9ACTN|nr:phage tail tape measure protein [Actinoplanes humidus]GIE26697.1 hypothetical protein Ahu01nite_097990 [Actinoplanes humidus]
MSVLRTAYVTVMPQLDSFGSELTKRLKRIDASKDGKRFGSQFSAGAQEKIKAGLSTGLGAIGLGAGIGASVSAGLTGALNVGKANDKLRAQLDLSKAESGRIGTASGQLFAKGYGESMSEVNDAIASVVQNLPSLRNASVPVLKEISAGALDISRVFGEDVMSTTSAISSMLKSGIAPNAKAALDILTKGFQSGANKGQDLLDTFTEYSVQFAKLGLDGGQSLALINQLLAGGARNSDLAADAIKEFSLRAIDGSKTTVAGYKLLGLNAESTAAAIAKGGPAATSAFGTIVSKLNNIQDPIKRNTAGVDLFGTKWEDLGDAFRNLDVAKATKGIGDVADGTQRLVDQSDSAKITSWGRSIQGAFVGVISGQAIPAVEQFATANREKLQASMQTAGDIGHNVLLPALQSFGSYVTGTLVPAVGSVVGWFREHATVTQALAVTIGVTYAVIKGYEVVTRAAAVATTAWTVAQRIASGATKIWAAGQWLLNAAMAANPIGLVIAGILALGAAVVIAYQKSETFRNIVQGAWQGIQTAAQWAWEKVIRPAVTAMVWYFQNVIAPVATWLWKNVVGPAFSGIGWAAKAAWVVIQIALKAWQNYLQNVIFPVVRYLYDNVVKPVFSAIGSVISAWWRNVVVPAFNGVQAAFSAVGSAFSAVWRNVLRPMFSTFGGFLTKTVAPAFGKGVDAIKGAWAKVEAAAKVPVEFVVNSVINPLVRGINKVAGAVGVKDRIPEIPGFAKGGRIPGAPSFVDNRIAAGPGGPLHIATGEFIVNSRDTSRALPLLRWVNDGMKGGPAKIARYLGRPLTGEPGDGSEGYAFADGGLVGWVKDVWGALSDPKKLIKEPFEAALARIPGGGMVRDFLAGAARRVLNGAIGFMSGGGEAGRAGEARAFIQSQAGKPYVWSSAGPNGYDCSGIVSAAWNILKGRSPYAHTFSTASLPGPWFDTGRTSGPLMAGWSHPGQAPASASVGHMAGVIAGMPFESRGSRGVIVGKAARRVGDFANHGAARFADGGLVGAGRVPVFDAGGTLAPGINVVNNATGRPEPLVRANGDMLDLLQQIRDALAVIDRSIGEVGSDVGDALGTAMSTARRVGRAG